MTEKQIRAEIKQLKTRLKELDNMLDKIKPIEAWAVIFNSSKRIYPGRIYSEKQYWPGHKNIRVRITPIKE